MWRSCLAHSRSAPASVGPPTPGPAGAMPVHAARHGNVRLHRVPQFSTPRGVRSVSLLGHGTITGDPTSIRRAWRPRGRDPYATLAMVTDYDCWRPRHESVTADQIIANLMTNADAARTVLRGRSRSISRKPADLECALRLAPRAGTPRAVPYSVAGASWRYHRKSRFSSSVVGQRGLRHGVLVPGRRSGPGSIASFFAWPRRFRARDLVVVVGRISAMPICPNSAPRHRPEGLSARGQTSTGMGTTRHNLNARDTIARA